MTDDLKAVREAAHGLEADQEYLKTVPVKEKYDMEIENSMGEKTLVHVYVPEDVQDNAPVLINLHGGGFVKGYRGRDMEFGQNYAYHSGCILLDVDYKIAPEKMFPYALEECYSVVKYVSNHAEELKIDKNKIILMGESAGGNMAIGVNILNKERKDFSIRQLIVCYPPMDLDKDPVEKVVTGEERDIKYAETARKYNEWYVGDHDHKDKLVSPIFAGAEDLSEFPPTFVFTGEKDSLGKEGEDFALKLIRAGVTVTAKRFMGANHGFLVRRIDGADVAEKLIFDRVEEIKKAWR